MENNGNYNIIENNICGHSQVKLKFDHFDTDKSGLIEFNEFENMMYTLLHCSNKPPVSPWEVFGPCPEYNLSTERNM